MTESNTVGRGVLGASMGVVGATELVREHALGRCNSGGGVGCTTTATRRELVVPVRRL